MVFLTEIVLVLRDLVLAIVGAFVGPRRRHYEHVVQIAAPRSIIWRMLRAHDITFDGMVPLRAITRIDPARPDIEHGILQMGERQLPMTTRIAKEVPEEAIILEIMEEGTDPAILMGANDYIGIFLSDDPKGTRMAFSRDLEPNKWHAPITIPIGLRNGGRRYQRTAEKIVALEATSSAAAASSSQDDDPAPPLPPPPPATHLQASSFGLTPNGLLLAVLALASFSYLWGWQKALLLTAIIILHELGHALAMLIVGIPVKGVYLVPFFGGAAIAGAPYRNEGQSGFVALMGPGFSLLSTLLFALMALQTGNPLMQQAMEMSAIVNLINLAPIYPLDGGQVLKAVLVSVSRGLAQAVGMLGAAAGLWLAWSFRDPLLGAFMALGMLATLQIRKPSTVAPMRWPGAMLLFVAFLATVAAYVAVLYAGT